jgi:hypothetical protein
VVLTVATDGAEMYASELARATRRWFGGTFDVLQAAEVYGQHVAGAATDHFLELTARDRDRIFNLGYYTWVEQQGVPLADFQARRDQAFWRHQRDAVHAVGRRHRGVQPAGGRYRRMNAGPAPRPRGESPTRPAVEAVTDRSTVRCAGCGASLPDTLYPFRCPHAETSPDIDHVVTRVLAAGMAIDADRHPFLRYRRFLYSWHYARAHGLGDTACIDLVRRLDAGVAVSRAAASDDAAAQERGARGAARHEAARGHLDQGRDRRRGRLAQGAPPHGHHDPARGRAGARAR